MLCCAPARVRKHKKSGACIIVDQNERERERKERDEVEKSQGERFEWPISLITIKSIGLAWHDHHGTRRPG